MLRAKTGDHAAFTALAADAIDRLHRTARLILRDSDRAADAVQDALLSAWLDIRAVRDPDRFDAWLNRLLVRACYRVAGRERRPEMTEITVDPLDAPAPEDMLVGGIARRIVPLVTVSFLLLPTAAPVWAEATCDRSPPGKVANVRGDAWIASGAGLVFAPSHRPFREWVAIPAPDEATWAGLLAEARAFVSA